MNQGEELWDRYCRFHDRPFHQQVAANRAQIQKYFEQWKQTRLARQWQVTAAQRFEEVPVTEYDDYPRLHEFGHQLEAVTRTRSRRGGELWWDYYSRISQQLVPFIQEDLADDFAFCTKTSGTTGQSKWVVHGATFWEIFAQESIASAVLCCSERAGTTQLRVGDRALTILAPVPYLSGWGSKAFHELVRLVPPIEVTDNEPSMRKKFYLAFKAIEEGEQIELAGGVGSLLYMICQYFLAPNQFYGEYYRAMPFGFLKLGVFLKWLQTRLSGTRVRDIRALMPLKGITLSGVDARLYAEFFEEHFGVETFNLYGATELGQIMRGDPDRKGDLVPNLRMGYWEFETPEGVIQPIDALQRGGVYALIGTAFGSSLIRYRLGDLVRVIDFRDDGMPVFSFEGRLTSLLDVYGYFRLTADLASRALAHAGLRLSDKWAVTKQQEPAERLCFVMEKSWAYTPEEAATAIFQALRAVFPDFRRYVEDFGITHIADVIMVEYLKPGAFLRYSALQARKGVPMGQYKPPKIIPPQRTDVYSELRQVS